MGHMSYNKIGSRRSCHGTRGFRLNMRRFSVQRIRAKLFFMIRFFSRLRLSSSYGNNCLQCLKKSLGCRKKSKEDHSSRRNLVMMRDVAYRQVDDYRWKSYARSNSFYSEAIADCLDFIKRNSVSLDEQPVLQR